MDYTKLLMLFLIIVLMGMAVYEEVQTPVYNINPTFMKVVELGEFEDYQVEVRELEVTAYSPLDDQNGLNADENPEVTATMTPSRVGVVAVNPEVIPYGTVMYIPDYGWGIAEDTGSAMRERDDLIDVMMMTYKEAKEWGRQQKQVVLFHRKGGK